MKKIFAIVLALSLLLAVCMVASAEEKKYTIGFEPYTLTNEYFTAVQDGFIRACEKYGVDYICLDPQNDPTTQASQIDDMIASGVDAIVYLPYDSSSCRTVLQTMKEAGVVVVNIDTVVEEGDYDLVDAIISSDNLMLGELAGQWVVEHHPDGANIAVAHLQVAESCIINVEGFWKAIKENAADPDAFVEVQVVEGGGDTEVTFSAIRDVLEAHPEVDVIYCINDPSAYGAIQAVEDAGLTGKVDVLGKDGAPTGKHNIAEGKEVQSSAQRPTFMGYSAVETALKILNGEEVEFQVLIPSYSITADNIGEFDLDAWDALEE
ncbi:MAG: substrate-binding domain-containing protein [Clostridia bacterium]|nr:substrate-binding domain-containing protein [Clostridia bacterium]